jgi:hypothetical protein
MEATPRQPSCQITVFAFLHWLKKTIHAIIAPEFAAQQVPPLRAARSGRDDK